MMQAETGIPLTAGTRDQVKVLEDLAAFGAVTNCELYPCEKGTRKFSVGDRLELFGLEEYPELDGEIVYVTAYRESKGDSNGYYIRSVSGNVERWLNFVWEKRLRVPE